MTYDVKKGVQAFWGTRERNIEPPVIDRQLWLEMEVIVAFSMTRQFPMRVDYWQEGKDWDIKGICQSIDHEDKTIVLEAKGAKLTLKMANIRRVICEE